VKPTIFSIFILLGSLQGFLLAAMFLTSKKLNRRSNFFLALLLLAISILNVGNSLAEMKAEIDYPFTEFLPLNTTLLIPFAFFYFVQYITNADYQFSKKEYLLLLPFAFQFLVKIIQLFLFFTNPSFLQAHLSVFNIIIQALELLAIVYFVVVLVMSLRKINRFQEQIKEEYADIESKSLFWLKNIITATFILWFLWAIPYFYGIFHTQAYLYPLWIGMTILVYWLAFSMHNRRDLFEFTPLKEPIQENILQKELSEKTEQHYQRLLQIMESEQLYLEHDITLTSIAEKLDLSSGYLSQIIHQKEGLNFYDFINKYRVEVVKMNLNNEKFAHLSLYGIALESGFKSKSTFNLAFKKMTGKTPTEFKKNEAI
jgi:AraC-like DNA-binding protein